MVTRTREVPLYRDSSDTKVFSAGIEVWTGPKWRAQNALAEAIARLFHSGLVGSEVSGPAGIGSKPGPQHQGPDPKKGCAQQSLERRTGVSSSLKRFEHEWKSPAGAS